MPELCSDNFNWPDTQLKEEEEKEERRGLISLGGNYYHAVDYSAFGTQQRVTLAKDQVHQQALVHHSSRKKKLQKRV